MFDKLVDLIVVWIKLLFVSFTLKCYQQGVVLRFGKFHRMAEPGFHLKWPFDIETCLYCNITPETMKVGPQSLTTKDGRSVVVSSVVTFQVEDAKKYILEVDGTQQVVMDTTYGTVASFVMEHTWDQLRSVAPVETGEKIVDADNEISKIVRRQAKKYGVHVQSVKFSDCTVSRSIRLMQQLDHASNV